MKAVQELHRILKINGCGLIYAWAKDQQSNSKPSTYLLQQNNKESHLASHEITTETNVRLPVHENRTNFKHNDLLVPWTKKTQEDTLHRFYHVFDESELKDLVNEALGAENVDIESLYYDQGNWCVIFRKLRSI